MKTKVTSTEDIKVAWVVNVKLGFVDWFFDNLIILIT